MTRRLALALTVLYVGLVGCAPPGGRSSGLDPGWPVGSFTLTDQDGQTYGSADLEGKVWVAAFIFTRCAGPCPQVSGSMARLQHELADEPDVRLVTFTVDPNHDTPAILSLYAMRFNADAARWRFLTGPREDVYRVIHDGFKLGVQPNEQPGHSSGEEVTHSQKLVVVDGQGNVRGLFDGASREEPEAEVARVRDRVRALLHGTPSDLPMINAMLNATCAVLLLVGYVAIRQRLVLLHKVCMFAALGVSALFLGLYLCYHIVVRRGQPTVFAGPSEVRWIYYAILGSHTILAMAVAPLALYVAYQGVRDRLARHVRVARWTLPLWLYVSVTGVVVYWMLYRLYPSH